MIFSVRGGFTLIELMVVMAIISTLSVVGFSVFSNAQKNVRNAERKSEINAIAKTLETKFDPGSKVFYPVTGADFSGGKIPTPPEGGSYFESLSSPAPYFRTCAALEGNPTATCNAPSNTCYCVDNSQGQPYPAGSPTPTPTPTSTPIPTPVPTPTPTSTPVPTPTPTSTPIPTSTPTPGPGVNKRVFLTWTNYPGALGGLIGADQKCQSSAVGVGLSGIWVAWISDSTTAAKDRVTQTTGDYIRIDGVVVANGWADLTDGTIDNPITISEDGLNHGGTNGAWTGTGITGLPVGNFCNNWTDGTTAFTGNPGVKIYVDGGWTDYSGADQLCSNAFKLYCFEK
jgi:prepilin-type N-terminal cleavage/methylation domain-containing protein